MTVDTHDDDFDIDTTELDNLPADEVDADDDLDEDFGLSYDGLTQAEIDAINADTDEGGNSDEDEDTEADATDDSDAGDNDTANDAETDGTDDADTTNQDDYQQEAATIAEKRAAIDAEFDAKLAELEALGKQYDDGDILDGAYNTAKVRIERDLKRIEAREAELVTKEDEIAERETSKQEQFQNDFAVAVNDFMARPENKPFVEGSPEFAALDQQLGVIAQSMPPGTPFDVLLNKARAAVSSYMDLPDAGKKEDKPADKSVKPDPETMPSISNMPAVVANSNDNGKFAHLDKLDGPALERAIADMSEAQQNEYLLNQ
ncbi:hypothetical protein [Psychrobacter sp. Marseille-P5312]|uniref:hypothetical protein n=1 Tax=Psychrobacter sp. Marseille-P5312 TaxID=2086574 RepID=UPI000CF65801|nr:hypothetical protein [Psychrobacter sp. Marseille-P5312]